MNDCLENVAAGFSLRWGALPGHSAGWSGPLCPPNFAARNKFAKPDIQLGTQEQPGAAVLHFHGLWVSRRLMFNCFAIKHIPDNGKIFGF
ncbi:MAG: hypothetical protein FJ134_09525 [Deltaproteobacteria bacterium]|nr:hypothetical protein [Deltaproteobacteria bacterium]